MSAFDFIQKWLSPLLDPLNQVRNAFLGPGSPNDIHANSIGDMLATLAPFSDPATFTGESADAFWAAMQGYLNAENALLPGIADAASTASLTGTLIAPIAPAEDIALDSVVTAAETATGAAGEAGVEAAGELGGSAGLDEIIGGLAAVDAAQAGMDPVTDVPTAVLIAVDIGWKVAIVVSFCWTIYDIFQRLIRDWNGLVHKPLPVKPPISSQSTPLPLPPQPAIPAQLQNRPDLASRYLSLITGNGNYSNEIVDMLLAGYSNLEITERLKAITQAGGDSSLIFSISGDTNLNELSGGPRLAFFWLSKGSWDGTNGFGLRKIIAKHAQVQVNKYGKTVGSDLSCWGIGTVSNPIIEDDSVISLLKEAIQRIAHGEATKVKSQIGNYTFELNPFQYNGRSCPLIVVFGPNGEVISAYQPK